MACLTRTSRERRSANPHRKRCNHLTRDAGKVQFAPDQGARENDRWLPSTISVPQWISWYWVSLPTMQQAALAWDGTREIVTLYNKLYTYDKPVCTRPSHARYASLKRSRSFRYAVDKNILTMPWLRPLGNSPISIQKTISARLGWRTQ